MEAQRFVETLKGTQLVLELPASFSDCRVEVIVLAMDKAPRRRRPPASLAGKMTYDDDLFDSAPATAWNPEQ